MEFKGKQRAEEYVNNAFFDSGKNKNINQCFKNFAKDGFLNGYNQALEDSKSNEMLYALITTLEELEDIDVLENHRNYIEQLIKQATEL